MLNVYGSHPFNFTIDLCTLLHGELCPLPMYNFTGTDSIPLPSSLGVSHRIPGIAYKIPDLEAFAQLTLVETSTGVTKACVQSTLSNGWSTHQKAVEWSTGGIALLALLSAIWQSVSPAAIAPHRLVELVYIYQTIAATGFLDLNYPSVYRAFTLNFAWAMGLFDSPSVQRSIDSLRHKTGGDMANSSGGSAVGLINRAMSPYNVPAQSSIDSTVQSLPMIAQKRWNNHMRLSEFTGFVLNPKTHISVWRRDVQTVTQASDNILQAGIPVYTNSIHIATADAFMTIFFSALILMAGTLFLLCISYLAITFISRTRQGRFTQIKSEFPSFARAWSLRIVS